MRLLRRAATSAYLKAWLPLRARWAKDDYPVHFPLGSILATGSNPEARVVVIDRIDAQTLGFRCLDSDGYITRLTGTVTVTYI